jgi:hypothetical protein
VVVAPHGAERQLAAQTVDMATSISRAVNVPLVILAASPYVSEVQRQLDQADHACELITLGNNIVRETRAQAQPDDLVIVATIGPRMRFRSSLGYIPEQLASTIPSSLAVIHYP